MDLAITRPGIVVPTRADPLGITGPTPDAARGRRFRTTSPGRFVPADVDAGWVEQRIVDAAAGAPPGSAVTGWAALRWQHARWFGGVDAAGAALPVWIAIGDAACLARRSGVRFVQDWLFEDDIRWLDGLPVTRNERSVCVAALRARNLEEAVQVVSMAAAADLVSLDEVAVYAQRLGPRPHTRKLRAAVTIGDENLWSPMEASALVTWLGAGLPRPLCNPPVFGPDGSHLFTPDLFDPVGMVVGQYDGVVHDLRRVRRRDLGTEELCRDLGLEVVTMISTDLRDRSAFERRLRAAYRRAAGRPRRDGWTLDLPSWWVDTSTVDKRRALDDWARELWLRRQRA